MDRPLRVGILVDSLTAPAWVHRLIERISAMPETRLVLVALNDSPPPKACLGRRLRRAAGSALLRADRKRTRCQPDAMAPVSLNELLGQAEMVHVQPRREGAFDIYSEQDARALRERDLDVLAALGSGVPKGPILSSARVGVWSLYIGDDLQYSGEPCGFWEVMEHSPVIGSQLRKVSDDPEGDEVLCRSFSATSHWSTKRTLNGCYWKSLSFLPRQLRQLHALGPEAFEAKVRKENPRPHPRQNPPRSFPTNLQAARCGVVLASRRAAFWFERKLRLNQWAIRFSFEAPSRPALWRFQEYLPPKDRFRADPHIILHEGKYHVFLEECLFRQGKGYLVATSVDAEGRWQEPVKVLERDYHLSNPFVFRNDGRFYMIPESSANRSVDLYECQRFPDQWRWKMTLLSDIAAVDATPFFHDGRWWIFANVMENPGAPWHDELFLFHSASLLSADWTPHPGNPIVSDVRCARPAGPIFRRDGVLCRPAQDCSRRYGYGIRFMRIDRLSTTEYQETEYGAITPEGDRRYLGMHGFDQVGALTLIDAIRRRWRFF